MLKTYGKEKISKLKMIEIKIWSKWLIDKYQIGRNHTKVHSSSG